jgi:hypothetical protein
MMPSHNGSGSLLIKLSACWWFVGIKMPNLCTDDDRYESVMEMGLQQF